MADRGYTDSPLQRRSPQDLISRAKPAFGDANDGTGEPTPATTVEPIRRVEGVAAVEDTIFGVGQRLAHLLLETQPCSRLDGSWAPSWR